MIEERGKKEGVDNDDLDFMKRDNSCIFGGDTLLASLLHRWKDI